MWFAGNIVSACWTMLSFTSSQCQVHRILALIVSHRHQGRGCKSHILPRNTSRASPWLRYFLPSAFQISTPYKDPISVARHAPHTDSPSTSRPQAVINRVSTLAHLFSQNRREPESNQKKIEKTYTRTSRATPSILYLPCIDPAAATIAK